MAMLVDPLEITQEKSADGAAIEAVFKLRDRPLVTANWMPASVPSTSAITNRTFFTTRSELGPINHGVLVSHIHIPPPQRDVSPVYLGPEKKK
jgi:hypothetical protein